MSKILVLSNSIDPHVDLMTPLLQEVSEVVRVDTDEFLKTSTISIGSGEVFLENESGLFDLSTFSVVWNRRPKAFDVLSSIPEGGMREFASREGESAVIGLLQRSIQRWINPISANLQAKNKVLQLSIAEGMGFSMPRYLISNSPEKVRAFFDKQKKGVIYKPLTWGVYEDGDQSYAISTSKVSLSDQLLNGLKASPCLFQECLIRQSDIRVTFFGKKCFAVEIDSTKIDGQGVRMHLLDLEHKEIQIPSSIYEKCVDLMRYYGLEYAALDFIKDEDGKWIFLELNPNGQWGWQVKKTNLPMKEAMRDLLLCASDT